MEKITEDMESLEMHSAVRNLMRLFDRIKDFEKRVLARQPALSAADREALIEALHAADRSCSAPSRRTSPRSCGSRSVTRPTHRRRGQAYRLRYRHEPVQHRIDHPGDPRADALVRHGARLPSLRALAIR